MSDDTQQRRATHTQTHRWASACVWTKPRPAYWALTHTQKHRGTVCTRTHANVIITYRKHPYWFTPHTTGKDSQMNTFTQYMHKHRKTTCAHSQTNPFTTLFSQTFYPQNKSFQMINIVILAWVWSLWRVQKQHKKNLIWEVSLGLKPSWRKTNQCHILHHEAPQRCLPEANYAGQHTSGHFNCVCLISDKGTLSLCLKDHSSMTGIRWGD